MRDPLTVADEREIQRKLDIFERGKHALMKRALREDLETQWQLAVRFRLVLVMVRGRPTADAILDRLTASRNGNGHPGP